MWKAVRVSSSGSWAYMPMSTDPGRLLSEEGPVFPRPKAGNHTDIGKLSQLPTNGVPVSAGRLVFGYVDGCMSYNGFLDMSVLPGNDPPLPMSQHEPVDGDIVVAVFEDRTLPAQVSVDGHRVSISLSEDVPPGKRCMILGEDGKLVSASYESQGGDSIRMAPRLAVASWIYNLDAKATGSPFEVRLGGEGFVISNSSSGKTYTAPLKGTPNEVGAISYLLGMHGLAGVIPKYTLRRVKENANGQDNRAKESILG